jgi:hypothetical protein
MNKCWYIIIQGKQEGPYSFIDLSKNEKLTPDTLVWREGFDKWIPMRQVAELQEIFRDKPKSIPIQERFQTKKIPIHPVDKLDAVLSSQMDPYQFYLWIVCVILIILYIIYRVQF